MKIFFFVSMLMVSCFKSQAQIKILFDASKAETAGNADWIIDADTNNLGYSGGPAVPGSGNESNAQQTPSPAQSVINDSTPEAYWTGALSHWAIDCVNRGYEVRTLPYDGQITYGNVSNLQDLSNYDVFIVCEPNILFTQDEKTAIISFVQNGGGLFMISDHNMSDRNNDGWDSPYIWNDLMGNNPVQVNPFGISFDYLDFSQTSANVPSLPADSILHGPAGDVTEVKWSGGTSMTLDPLQNPSVVGAVYKTGSLFGNNNVMCSYARYGNGKVAALGDSSPCDDSTGDANDQLYNGYITDANGNHQRLLMNITIWLAGGNSTAGISTIQLHDSFQILQNTITGNSVNVKYSIKEPSEMIINVRDMNGKTIREVLHKRNMPGEYGEVIHLGDIGDGIYNISFSSNNFLKNLRLVVVR